MVAEAYRISCRGTQSGGELWANIWHVTESSLTNPLPSLNQAIADEIADNFRTFYANSLVNGDRHNGWALDQIFVSDLQTFPPTTFESDITPLVGASSTPPAPYEIAMVVSLQTALNSRRGRGRIYLNGWTNTGITAEGTDSAPSIPTTLRNNVADAVLALDDNNRLGPLASVALAVYSQVDDAARRVTRIRVGNRHDTQRRRGAALVESFVNRTTPG